jgi:aldose sugar dehydrogenase
MKTRKNAAPEDVEVVASGLRVPWAIDWTPDGRLLFTERPGTVSENTLNGPKMMLRLNVVFKEGDEGGLLGLAVSPDYGETHRIYLYYTYQSADGSPLNRVSSFEEGEDHMLHSERVIIEGLPGGRVHNGGRIKFGPDGKLYVTVGETWHKELAQNRNSLGGKILRLNLDGSVPSDNPFKGSPIWSYGNRNPQGLAWHPETGALFSSEHGPSGENGWFAHDEVNLIEPGRNYGWPEVIGYTKDSRFVSPVYQTGYTTWAPSGCAFITSPRYPKLRNRLLVANLRGTSLASIAFTPPAYRDVEIVELLYEGELGRLRDVAQGLDGCIYLCTSNRDGRGSPHPDDDLIVRIR